MAPSLRAVLLATLFVAAFDATAHASPYVGIRAGFGTGRYRAIDPQLLERDEHDFRFGTMFDVEAGYRWRPTERAAFLLGARLQYSARYLEGTYTAATTQPDVALSAHIPALFVTLGVQVTIVDALSAILQVDAGPSYVLWYEDGEYVDSFLKFYLPIDLALNYELPSSWSVEAGVSVVPPIYRSSTVNFFVGARYAFDPR